MPEPRLSTAANAARLRALRPFAAALVLVCLAGLPGCRNRAANQAPAPVVTVGLGPDEPTKALPPDFDKRMPVYPGAVVEHVRRPRGAMREILFSSDAPIDKLIESYRESLHKAGFEVTSSLKMAARRTWSCDFHRDGQQCGLMIFPSDEDKAHLTIDLIYEMPSKSDEIFTEPEEHFDVVGPGEVAQQPPREGRKEGLDQWHY